MKVFLGIILGYTVVSVITAKSRAAKLAEVYNVCEGKSHE